VGLGMSNFQILITKEIQSADIELKGSILRQREASTVVKEELCDIIVVFSFNRAAG
jgi:hypothetical protein